MERADPVTGNADVELAGLLRAAIAGDEHAYSLFLHRAGGLVRGFCRRRIVADTIDVEDVVQETLLAIHRKRHTWRTDAPVMPWVYAIARFKLTDAFRRRGRRMEVELDDAIADTLAAPEQEIVSGRELTRILETLAPGQKAVVSAISIEGQSIAQVSVSLGMTQTAVRVALHRGLAAISRRFGQGE